MDDIELDAPVASTPQPHPVVITGIKLPFWRMLELCLQWSIAVAVIGALWTGIAVVAVLVLGALGMSGLATLISSVSGS